MMWIDDLERKAKAATPGLWTHNWPNDSDNSEVAQNDEHWVVAPAPECDPIAEGWAGETGEADIDYIVACSPEVILLLIAVARAGRELFLVESEPDLDHLGAFTQARRKRWIARRETALAAFREAWDE